MASLPHSPKFHLLVLLGILLCFSLSAFCQFETATISGTITDQSGAVIKSADVKLTNVQTGFVSTTTSNDSGLYVFPSVRPGHYRMEVVKQGFRQIVLTDLTVNVQDTLSRNFSLQVGVVGESVTVSGDVAKVNTQDASVSTVVDSQFVENMPLNGRSFQSLIYMTPGVVITPGDPQGQSQFSVNGQRGNANYFTIDGVSANFGASYFNQGGGSGVGQTLGGTTPAMTIGGGTNSLVSVDAMQEFRIQTSTYAPEFGRQPGGQISIVTKGGANQWHGTAFEYLRNDLFDARNYFDWAHTIKDSSGNVIQTALPKSPLRQNDFGGTFSGPLWKDHTFFFFSYEGLRLRSPQTSHGYYFTAAEKANITGPWAPVINATPTGPANGQPYTAACGPNGSVAGQVTAPTDPAYVPCQTQLNFAYSNPSAFDAVSLRLDHKLTDKINLFARYNHAPSSGAVLYGGNQNELNYANTDTATLGLTATLSPTLVNDFRGNWSRQVAGSTYQFKGGFGAVAPSSLSDVVPPGYGGSLNMSYSIYVPGSGAGLSIGSYAAETQRQLNFVDTISKTVGPHQFKFGVDYRRLMPSETPTNTIGVDAESWNSIMTGYTDFFLNLGGQSLKLHTNNLSFFGQDTWRASNKLTLTYGLRWDISTAPVSDSAGKPLYTLSGVFDSGPMSLVKRPAYNTDYTGFAPRIGAAYQVTPKTTLRGGFGMFYDIGVGGAISFAFSEPPYYNTYIDSGVPLDFSYKNAAGQSVYAPMPSTMDLNQIDSMLEAVDPHLKLPVTFQWNAALEREIGEQSLTVTYLGARRHNLLYNFYLPPQQYAFQTNATMNLGGSQYNALQLQLMRRMHHGLQAMVSYSFSHSNDAVSSDYYTQTSDSYAGISQIKAPPMTPSDFDVHQNFSAAVSYDIPNPAWGGKPGKAVFGGWALDSVYKYQTGPPIDVTINVLDPNLGFVTTRPERVAGQPIWIKDSTQPAGKALNPDAFIMPAAGVSTDSLRNSIPSPYGISQADFALRRRFNLTEKVKLDFRAEYFNIFNHPMFGGTLAPYAWWGMCFGTTPASCTYKNSWFGKVFHGNGVSSAGGQTLNVGLGSQAEQYAPGGPRSGQFTLRLSF